MATTTFSHTTEFQSLGDYLHAMVRAAHGLVDPRLQAMAGSDEHHGESISRGGASVPEELLTEAFRRRGDSDPILSRVTRVPMRSSRMKIAARVDANHTTSVSGGLTLERRPQTNAIDTSRVELEQVELEGGSLAGAVFVSDELLADGPIEMILERAFLDELAAVLLREFLFGTGVGESLGILNSPAIISISTSGQSTGTLTGANLQAMAARCWRYSSDGVWLANEDTRSALDAAFIALGSGSERACVHYEGGQAFVLGRPLFFSEECAAIGTTGDVVLGVWSEYLLGVRQDSTTESSVHVRFAELESALRFTYRGAGAPWWRAQLTPRNSVTTLSPFVVLDTRTV